MSRLTRRLAALEARQGGPNPFRACGDAEILGLLDLAAAEMPAATFAEAHGYGPPRLGRYADLSDDELLRQLDEARSAVRGTP